MLAGLYTAADWGEVVLALRSLNMGWLAAAMLMFGPQTATSAWRWKVLVSSTATLTMGQATSHTLAASAVNLAAPSKLGDFSKAGMIPGLSPRERVKAVGLATVEKAGDAVALAVWLAAGWLGWLGGTPWVGMAAMLLLTAGAWGILQGFSLTGAVVDVRRRYAAVGLLTLSLWGQHVLQIDFMLKAAGVDVSWSESVWRSASAVFAGLAPITVMGLGTRDAALAYLFRHVASPAALAAVGLLTALRYLVPGAVGIPFLSRETNKALGK